MLIPMILFAFYLLICFSFSDETLDPEGICTPEKQNPVYKMWKACSKWFSMTNILRLVYVIYKFITFCQRFTMRYWSEDLCKQLHKEFHDYVNRLEDLCEMEQFKFELECKSRIDRIGRGLVEPNPERTFPTKFWKHFLFSFGDTEANNQNYYSALPKVTYADFRDQMAGKLNLEKECAVCLEVFEPEDLIILFPCNSGHFWHAECG